MCAPNELQALLKETVTGLRAIFGEKLESVILYGSYARGDYDEESDVDVMAKLYLTGEEIRAYRPQVSALASEIGLKYDILLSIKLQDKAMFDRYFDAMPFFRNVAKDGVLLYKSIPA